MPVFKVLTYPHVLLKKKATPVEHFTPDLKDFTEGMAATMKAFEGIGLAAPQVGISKRVIVVDVTQYDKNEEAKEMASQPEYALDGVVQPMPSPLVLINPVLTKTEEEIVFPFDGCLSFPGGSGYRSRRFRSVEVEARSLGNQTIRLSARGILSICLQHEIDHLDGILFVDRLIEGDEASAIIAEMEKYEQSSEYRKQLKRLKPIDARGQKYAFT